MIRIRVLSETGQRQFFCKGYSLPVDANFVHAQEKGEEDQRLKKQNTPLQAERGNRIWSNCSLQQLCAAVGKDCRMPARYCRESGGRFESRKNVHTEVAPFVIENSGEVGVTGFCRDRRKEKAKQNYLL